MNQIAASILILSASILAHTATLRNAEAGFGSLLGLTALGMGLWGGMALMTASLRDRTGPVHENAETHGFGATARAAWQGLVQPSHRTHRPQDFQLSAETSARVAAVTQRRSGPLSESSVRRPPRSGSGVAA